MPSSEAENIHTSVLLDETVGIIDPRPGDVIVDATLGMGGHSRALLERQPGLRLIGLDQDLNAVEIARRNLAEFTDRLTIVHTNFVNVREALAGLGIDRVDGILADLGVSSLQFDSETRGFSFRFDAPLDMRMDEASDSPTAAELLLSLSEEEIANLIYRFGEERFSRRIARRIVERREAGNPVKTTKELANLVERAVRKSPKDKIHPATRTFQALRIDLKCLKIS
jgi:16S rRNA (cytosine1402-N4)-methyltransferase